MKRRKCPRCLLIEPSDAELRWSGDHCPVCTRALEVRERQPTASAPQPSRRGYKLEGDALERRRAGAYKGHATMRKRTKVEPGLCQKCKERKPVTEFSPRSSREPAWYPHHQRCKECVCEQAKEVFRKRWLAQFNEELPARTVRNLRSELSFLRKKVRGILAELERRREPT